VFKATGLIGINSAGKQKELAKEFIQLLFTKEIQSLNLEGAFPVNKAAMEEWIQFEDKDYYCIASDEKITAYYPEKDARDKIYECVRAANKPMVNDMVMMDMILDEAERYLRGDITAEQAASNAVASINLYLSE
jgi:ABC-type glycerol-3-phosphate transport system substrate-binding protein